MRFSHTLVSGPPPNLKFRAKLFFCWLAVCCSQAAAQAGQQIRARLSTSDTVVELTAGPAAPELVSLGGHRQNPWRNRAHQFLPAFVELGGTRIPLTWHLVPRSATVDAKHAIFVYESKEPHLRLSWQWTVRAPFGPIEHAIEVENLDGREFWMPIMDSLSLDWQISPAIPLRHSMSRRARANLLQSAPISTRSGRDIGGPVGPALTHMMSPVEGARSYPTRQFSCPKATSQAGTPASSLAEERA